MLEGGLVLKLELVSESLSGVVGGNVEEELVVAATAQKTMKVSQNTKVALPYILVIPLLYVFKEN